MRMLAPYIFGIGFTLLIAFAAAEVAKGGMLAASAQIEAALVR